MPTKKKHRVLIVEADEQLRWVLQNGLALTGGNLETEVEPDGGAALEACRKGGYDAILLDLQSAGWSCVELIGGLFRTDVQLFLLTSETGDERLRRCCVDSGADTIIDKPFSVAVLNRMLQKRFRRQEEEREEALCRKVMEAHGLTGPREGVAYIRMALLLLYRDGFGYLKTVYREIAERRGTAEDNVANAIRMAIRSLYRAGEDEEEKDGMTNKRILFKLTEEMKRYEEK